MQEDLIKHSGVISEITDHLIKVNIVAQSACASCHAKGYCGVSDMKEKIIEVKKSGNINQNVGDFVVVAMNQKLGIKAVMYGYMLPFAILMITLIGSLSYFKNEGVAGLAALSVLIPYYVTLYIFRDKLKDKFQFHIETTNSMNFTNFNITQK